MRKTAFLACVTLAVLAAAACQNSPSGPAGNSGAPIIPLIKIEALEGSWQAAKAEFQNLWLPETKRDLVAEGGAVTLMLDQSSAYSVSVTMPGKGTSVSTGRWQYDEPRGKPHLEFYASSSTEPQTRAPNLFVLTLSGDTLTLWAGLSSFLPYDFGWNDPQVADYCRLAFVFTRRPSAS